MAWITTAKSFRGSFIRYESSAILSAICVEYFNARIRNGEELFRTLHANLLVLPRCNNNLIYVVIFLAVFLALSPYLFTIRSHGIRSALLVEPERISRV